MSLLSFSITSKKKLHNLIPSSKEQRRPLIPYMGEALHYIASALKVSRLSSVLRKDTLSYYGHKANTSTLASVQLY